MLLEDSAGGQSPRPMLQIASQGRRSLDERSYHHRHVVADLLLPEQEVLPSFPVTNDDDDTVSCALRTAAGDSVHQCWSLLCFKSVPTESMDVYSFRWRIGDLGDQVPTTMPDGPRRLESYFRSRFFEHCWPPRTPGARVTAACLLKTEIVALGYDDGTVRIAPLSAVFYRTGLNLEPLGDYGPTWQCRDSRTHAVRVTALFEMTTASGADDLLLAGFADGRVLALDLASLDVLGTFQCHVESVVAFFRPPRQILPRYSRLACSIADDDSIVLMDLEETKALFTFSGHQGQIESISFRPEDAYMCVETKGGELYVWSLKSGHLDRVEFGDVAQNILATCDQKSRFTTLAAEAAAEAASDQTVMALPFRSTRRGEGIALLLVSANVKALCRDAHRGKRHFAGRIPSTSSLNGKVADRGLPASATPGSEAKPEAGSDLAPPKTPPSTLGNQRLLAIPEGLLDYAGRSSPGRASPGRATPSEASDAGGASADEAFIHAILSASLSWEMDAALDAMYVDKLDLALPPQDLALALKGAGDFWTCFSPSLPHGKGEWTVSNFVTASRILNILVLIRSVLSSEGLGFEEQIAAIITHYGVLLPDLVGPKFRPASLAYLVKFWQDPIPEVQQAARSLFRATIAKWTPETRERAIQYWYAKLVSREPQSSADSSRAAVILAILGSAEGAAMDSRICGEVSGALITMAGEGKTTGFRVTALELLGRGFSAWEPHISATSLIRFLEQLAGFLPPATGSPSSASAVPAPSQPAAVQQMARQAILSIATSSTAVFVQTLVLDLTHAKTVEERKGSLRLLSVFVHKKPVLLLPHLLRIVEGVIKCLEPNNPQLREALLEFVTAALHDLVKTYPTVSFHGISQRLICGDWDGPCVVFDLKTGQRFQVLEGHDKPVTAVAFSPSGRMAASHSAEDHAILVYSLSSGFFGLLSGGAAAGGALKPIRPSKFLSVQAAQPQSPRGDAWQNVRLEFTSERSLRLLADGHVTDLQI
ncbi:hypothetical protein DFJ74DRAFT_112744 [Hyaloraphidium curvatum]|nr:hypothetical protein DFJ74DRAFT_112744 [Hyaloraphidium curvatum]